jgi:hypothetical protein
VKLAHPGEQCIVRLSERDTLVVGQVPGGSGAAVEEDSSSESRSDRSTTACASLGVLSLGEMGG